MRNPEVSGEEDDWEKKVSSISLQITGQTEIVPNSGYQYKYNGKEWQDELNLNLYDYGARNYDPALGRFFVLDLFSEQFVNKTPYHYVSNDPVNKIDVEGHLEIVVSTKDPIKLDKTINYLKNGISEILKNPAIMAGLQKYGNFTEKQVKDKIVKYRQGSIKMHIVDADSPYNGQYRGGKDAPFSINRTLIDQIENASTKEEEELYILSFLMTALHETVHYGDNTYREKGKQWQWNRYEKFHDNNIKAGWENEVGRAFEIDVFWDRDIDSYYNQDINKGKIGKDGLKTNKHLVRKKMTADKMNELTKGIQDLIKSLQEANPNIDVFIIE